MSEKKAKPTCYTCKKDIIFDKNIVSEKSGRMIPLDPETKKPHECPVEIKTDENQTELSKQNEEKLKKNGHAVETEKGKETHQGFPISEKSEYVDHTLKGLSKVKIFSNETKSDTEIEYNKFLADNKDKIKTQGAHDHVTNQGEQEPLQYTIYLYYEEK